MCGLAGILRFDDEPIDTTRLEAMLAQVQHRGPDDTGATTAGRCGLAHARLSILDIASGHQPMRTSIDGSSLHVVFNGEIYNHRPLRAALQQRGYRFQTNHSDTEVLLHGYREWGTRLPEHLEGMFALALWDEHNRRLFLARDRVGKKPLYLAQNDRELIFGSLVATVVAGLPEGRSPAISSTALLNFLRLGYPFAASMIDGIEELPPAHWMLVEADGRCRRECYWQPQLSPRPIASLDALSQLEQTLSQAIGARLEADVPLGCFLSGGIDSSILAALAQRQLKAGGGSALKTFSVAMPVLDYDESPHAQAVADHLGTDHRVLTADPSDAVADLEHLMPLIGEPTADSSLLPTYWLCRTARQHVKVALSGDGGDELFAGYDRYRAIRLLRQHGWWLRWMPTGALRSANPRSLRTRLSRLLDAAKTGNQPASQYHQMIHLFTESQIAALGLSHLREPDASDHPTAPDWPTEATPMRAAMSWDFTHYLPYELLRKMDRASMAVALEVRCPLLDRRVCELANQLPDHVILAGGRPKGLLRALAGQYLPVSITHRPKRGFAIPIGTWFRQSMRDALADRLFDGTLDAMGIEKATVQRMFDQHATGGADHSHRLFALLQLSIWARWLHSLSR